MQFNRLLFGIKYSVSGSSGTNAVIFFYDKIYVVNLEIVMNELRRFGHVSYFFFANTSQIRQNHSTNKYIRNYFNWSEDYHLMEVSKLIVL